jgi:Uma2 family endonuclease
MSSAESPDFVDVASYLESERRAITKHEYINGWVRAMTGATNRHNVVAVNTLSVLWTQLKGKPCQAFNSDAKVKIERGTSTWFYYPDAMVVCEGNSLDDHFQQKPVLIVEVLSRSTRAIDLDEKLNNYLLIPTLQYCLFLEQAKPRAILMRRTEAGFLRDTFEGMEAITDLPAIGCVLPLSELYDRVDFNPDSIREEMVDYVAQ